MSKQKQIDDGGPAFPLPQDGIGDVSWSRQGGMSVRDYMEIEFAKMLFIAQRLGNICPLLRNQIATEARLMADAMLAARKESP